MAQTPAPEDPDKVNVEDLLRLKRSERPDDAFWGQFDRELHQRMLRTLVKKDPWYLQVMRGLTGRLAQTGAVAAAAALVAVMVMRPAFVDSASPSEAGVAAKDAGAAEMAAADTKRLASAPAPEVPGEAAGAEELSYSDLSSQAQARDYRIDSISARENESREAGFTRDFGMDRIQSASYDTVAYSTDSAMQRTSPFASTGVASLVY